jgi:glycosyltransferase involved in cell wall biosynthesis
LASQKIIIIGPAFPFRGGIADFNNALANAYSVRNDDVTLFSFTLQYPSFLFPGTTQYTDGVQPMNLKIRTIINSINPFNWFRVANKINNEKPDLVIIRYWLPFMSPCLGTIARLLNRKIKILAITDNVVPHEKRFGDNFLTKYFIKSCDAFVTLSSSVLDDLTLFTSSISKKFIPHPIYDIFGDKISKEQAINNLGLSSNNSYLLFFGFIRQYKGLDLMLNAMADERIKAMALKLIVAGEFYENKNDYMTLIDSLGIHNQVILHSDFISSENVKNYFCASDLITQTYKTATQSGVTQIAYNFERPMLVTDVGGLSEIVPNNRVGYVTSKNPNDIADAIVDFYQNKKEELFAFNVKEEKKRFSWESFINDIDKLMNSVKK